MDKDTQKKIHSLEKQIADSDALTALKNTEGWAVVKELIDGSVSTCLDNIFQSKKIKNWNDYLFYKAKYDVLTKLLHTIDFKTNQRVTADAELERIKEAIGENQA